MSVLALIVGFFLAIWFVWLIRYSSKKPNVYTEKLQSPIVKFPKTRVPSRFHKNPKPDYSFTPSGFENRQSSICQHERALLGACFGDAAKASALIDYELRRSTQSLSRSQAALSALERLRSDRR